MPLWRNGRRGRLKICCREAWEFESPWGYLTLETAYLIKKHMVSKKIYPILVSMALAGASTSPTESDTFGTCPPPKRARLTESPLVSDAGTENLDPSRFPGFHGLSNMEEVGELFRLGISIRAAFRMVGQEVADLSFIQGEVQLPASAKIADIPDPTAHITVIKTGFRPHIGVFYSKSCNCIHYYVYPVFAYQLEGFALLIGKVDGDIVIFKIQHSNIADLLERMRQELEVSRPLGYNGHEYGLSKGLLHAKSATLGPYDRVSAWIKTANPEEYKIPRGTLEVYSQLPEYSPTEWKAGKSGTFLGKITSFRAAFKTLGWRRDPGFWGHRYAYF